MITFIKDPEAYLKKAEAPKPAQPADLLPEWVRQLRQIEPDAVLDFSWSRDAVTICDMRRPASPRTENLYTSSEIRDGAYKIAGDFERRVREFIAKG